MRKTLLISFILATLTTSLNAQKTDKQLFEKVASLLKGFNGDVGVFIKSLKTNKIVAINADTIFPTASIVKIPILIGIIDKIEKKEFDYHQQLRLHSYSYPKRECVSIGNTYPFCQYGHLLGR